jgi:hypothetical protein
MAIQGGRLDLTCAVTAWADRQFGRMDVNRGIVGYVEAASAAEDWIARLLRVLPGGEPACLGCHRQRGGAVRTGDVVAFVGDVRRVDHRPDDTACPSRLDGDLGVEAGSVAF